MPVWLKWIITVAYIIISPCLAILEDSLSAKTVFELAYDFKYNKLEDESEEEI